MRNYLSFAFGASLLVLLGACGSNDKPVETTAQDNSPSGDTAVVMRDNVDPETMYRRRATRIARRVSTDLNLTDTVARSKFEMAYYNRAKRYGELRTKYQADTTGQYQAMRQAEMETDKEVQTILTDPQMYKTYESRRIDYSDDKYMDDPEMTSGGMGTTSGDSMSAEGSGSGSNSMSQDGGTGVGNGASGSAMGSGDMEGGKSKVKIKGEDGSKIKMKDGDVKYKDADGNKTKTNGN